MTKATWSRTPFHSGANSRWGDQGALAEVARRATRPDDGQPPSTTTAVVQGENLCERSVDVTELAAKILDEDPRARQALAEYFMILRQWALDSRPDDGLAPDSNSEDP